MSALTWKPNRFEPDGRHWLAFAPDGQAFSEALAHSNGCLYVRDGVWREAGSLCEAAAALEAEWARRQAVVDSDS